MKALKQNSKKGFTLIETVIALVIIGIIGVGVFQVSTQLALISQKNDDFNAAREVAKTEAEALSSAKMQTHEDIVIYYDGRGFTVSESTEAYYKFTKSANKGLTEVTLYKDSGKVTINHEINNASHELSVWKVLDIDYEEAP